MNAASGKSANTAKTPATTTKTRKVLEVPKMQVQLGQQYLQVYTVDHTELGWH